MFFSSPLLTYLTTGKLLKSAIDKVFYSYYDESLPPIIGRITGIDTSVGLYLIVLHTGLARWQYAGNLAKTLALCCHSHSCGPRGQLVNDVNEILGPLS